METLDLHLKQLVKLMKVKKENRNENINKDEKEVKEYHLLNQRSTVVWQREMDGVLVISGAK